MYINGNVKGKIIHESINGGFSIAMFDCWRVAPCLVFAAPSTARNSKAPSPCTSVLQAELYTSLRERSINTARHSVGVWREREKPLIHKGWSFLVLNMNYGRCN